MLSASTINPEKQRKTGNLHNCYASIRQYLVRHLCQSRCLHRLPRSRCLRGPLCHRLAGSNLGLHLSGKVCVRTIR